MISAVFTCGDINGIGPEISIKAFHKILSKKNTNPVIFICPLNVFEYYYKLTGSNFIYNSYNPKEELRSDQLNLIVLPNAKLNIGKSTITSGRIAYETFIKSIELIQNKLADLLVTSPVSKEAINNAGINFTGHTEILAKLDGSKNYLMTFLAKDLKASLLTIHKSIKSVPGLVKQKTIEEAISVLYRSAQNDFGIEDPKIAVLGLNPHAGENGLIGNEELKIIKPVMNSLRKKYNLFGPFVPDAFWGNNIYKNYDMILGMYHDQVLIPFKMMYFNSGVNYTAGLNIVRTSPDHGTAFDIAGKNIADSNSIHQAYKFAIKIFSNRKKYLANSKNN